jgi:beta-carotene/zeaxanthin 4-ketolase
MQHDSKSPPLTGLLVAALVIASWIGSLALLSFIDISELIPGWILPAILGRTFIQTGLFIVTHDAIHGSVFSDNPRLNHAVGRLAVRLYALLSYQKLSLKHWQHHRHPGQAGDPDFYEGLEDNWFVWYLKFMQGYLDLRQTIVQFFGIGIIFLILHFGCHIRVSNLFLFWIIPIFLSSVQLFFFGTYLPHRIAEGRPKVNANSESAEYQNSHHARSSNYPPLWSFLTCYHFGYHWEHHEYPSLPWYSLPSVRQNNYDRTSDLVK